MLAPITNVALVPQLYPEVPFPIQVLLERMRGLNF